MRYFFLFLENIFSKPRLTCVGRRGTPPSDICQLRINLKMLEFPWIMSDLCAKMISSPTVRNHYDTHLRILRNRIRFPSWLLRGMHWLQGHRTPIRFSWPPCGFVCPPWILLVSGLRPWFSFGTWIRLASRSCSTLLGCCNPTRKGGVPRPLTDLFYDTPKKTWSFGVSLRRNVRPLC